tara:strand:+ start:2141 stop:6709 length:4569 start_codon:yes stop_codon:yes gene_type:complete
MANESTAYEKYKAELLGIPIDDDDELMSSERPTEIEPFEDISNTSTPYEEYKARLLQGSVITEKQPLDQPQIVPNDADPGPQIPRADPVDDPLGATSAVTSTDNMGLTKATSGATLKTELREDGYYSDIVADVYNEDDVIDFDIGDLTEEELKTAGKELQKELLSFKDNEIRDPIVALLGGSATKYPKTVLKIMDGMQYAMAGFGDIMIRDMELAKRGTYGKFGQEFYDAASELISGFGRTKKPETPRELVMMYAEGSAAAGEALAPTLLGTGTLTTIGGIRSKIKDVHGLAETLKAQHRYDNNVGGAELSTRNARREAEALARKTVDKLKDLKPKDYQEAITWFENRTDTELSTLNDKGLKVIDYEKVRDAGRLTIRRLAGVEKVVDDVVAEPVTLESVGFRTDNPTTKGMNPDWATRKQDIALEAAMDADAAGELETSKYNMLNGPQSGFIGTNDNNLFLNTEFVSKLKGAEGEKPSAGQIKYDKLKKDIEENGFDPDQKNNKIMIGVNHEGEAFILEGNNRAALALEFGVPSVKVEVKYFNGAETVGGDFSPENIIKQAVPDPRPSKVDVPDTPASSQTKVILGQAPKEGSDLEASVAKLEDGGAEIEIVDAPEPLPKRTVAEFIQDINPLTGETDSTKTIYDELGFEGEDLFGPKLNEKSLNAIIALASDYKTKYAGKKDANGVLFWNPKKKAIDNLFDITLRREDNLESMIPEGSNSGEAILINRKFNEDLLDNLAKYGMSLEQYALSAIGSASDAGRVLQKFRVLGKIKPVSEISFKKQQDVLNREGWYSKFSKRLEGTAKGSMVSALSTGSRNFYSLGVRTPMEALYSMVDNAMVQGEKGTGIVGEGNLRGVDRTGLRAIGRMAKSFVPFTDNSGWSGSFRIFELLYSRPDIAKDFTDLILSQPELGTQLKIHIDRINDIQAIRGRGEPLTEIQKIEADNKKNEVVTNISDNVPLRIKHGLDVSMGLLEDTVQTLNTPNIFLEMMTRKSYFLYELERQVKLEWDMDLMNAMQKGLLPDMLKDVNQTADGTIIRPTGKRSFLDMTAQANKRSLDVAFASDPDVAMFKEINNFISSVGIGPLRGTIVEPFSRFLFKSLEWMGQSMGGGGIPFMKKMSHLVTLGTTNKDMAGPLSFKDRERISRNVVGLAAVFGAYQYSKLGDAGDEVTQETFGSGENKGTVDTTFIYPIPQIRYIGNALHRMEEGTFEELFDPTEFKDLFLSGAMRSANKPFSLIEDIVSSFEDADITTDEKIAATGGRFLSAYFSRWLTQDRQWSNFKTAIGGITGSDDLKVRDLRAGEVETFSPLDSFVTNFTGPMRQARFGVSQEDITKAPLRQDIFKGPEGTTMQFPMAKLIGINVTSPTPPDGAFLKRYNYNWMLGSKSKHKGLKRVENALFMQAIPDVVAEGRRVEKESKDNYADQNDAYKRSFTLQEHIIKDVRKVVDDEIKLQRKIIREERWDEANFSEYQEASIRFRKLTASQRTTAYSEFVKAYGREPNYYSAEDLIELKGLLKDLK